MAKRTIEHVDTLIAKNERRLKLTMTNLDKLKKERKRLISKTLNLTDAPPREQGHIEMLGKPQTVKVKVTTEEIGGGTVKVTSHPVANPDNVKLTFEPLGPTGPSGPQCPGAVGVPAPVAPNPVGSDGSNLDIPDFLRRQSSPEAEQIKAEQAEAKKKKAAGRIAKMKAKKSGELRKMPVSGKAALDLIRNG